MKSNFISHLHSRTLYLSIILLSLVSYSFLDAAWTVPSGAPPTGNVAEPINEGLSPQTKDGPLTVTDILNVGSLGSGPILLDGDMRMDDSSPSVMYNDNTPSEKAFWSYVNNNIYYILADRNGDTSNWEGNHPLALYAGPTDATNDYATFANEVRATSYCNRAGASCFTSAQVPTVPAIGVSQIWTNLTASRSVGTAYRNTTGRPIMVAIDPSGQNNDYVVAVSNNNSTWITISSKTNGDGGSEGITFIVPDDVYYRMTGTAGIQAWAELR